MVEYALLVSLIAIVAIIALKELGNSTANQFVKIATDLGGAVE
jgi:Flp pilus assembly pilin Flp